MAAPKSSMELRDQTWGPLPLGSPHCQGHLSICFLIMHGRGGSTGVSYDSSILHGLTMWSHTACTASLHVGIKGQTNHMAMGETYSCALWGLGGAGHRQDRRELSTPQ